VLRLLVVRSAWGRSTDLGGGLGSAVDAQGVATGVEDLGDLVHVVAGAHQLDAGGFQAVEGIVLVAVGTAVDFGVHGLGDEARLGDAFGVGSVQDVVRFGRAGAEGQTFGPLPGLAGPPSALLSPLLVAALGLPRHGLPADPARLAAGGLGRGTFGESRGCSVRCFLAAAVRQRSEQYF